MLWAAVSTYSMTSSYMIPNKKWEKQSCTLTLVSFVLRQFFRAALACQGRKQSKIKTNETQHTSCTKSKGVNNLPAADTLPFPKENASNISQNAISRVLSCKSYSEAPPRRCQRLVEVKGEGHRQGLESWAEEMIVQASSSVIIPHDRERVKLQLQRFTSLSQPVVPL